MSTSKKCDGEFVNTLCRVTNDVSIASSTNVCENDAEWRVTYLHDTELDPVNCCGRCIMVASNLNLMYSAVRLETQ